MQLQTRSAQNDPSTSTTTQHSNSPKHPFWHTKDAAYTPLTSKNVGTQDKQEPPINKKQEPAYRTLPPIHDPSIAKTIYKQSMETPITITQRKLLSLSPEVWSQFRDSTITRRISNKDIQTTQAFWQEEIETTNEIEQLLSTISTFTLPTVTYALNGSITISDPIEAYYQLLPPGFEPLEEALTVSLESSVIQSILACIDTKERVECILDPGCQVITMSATHFHELGIAYDPTIWLNMQSANRNCNLSLGLAGNIPFLIENITFYLQVHIVGSVAFDILLGWPFDILTESIIHNFSDKDQTLTIKDPNTGCIVTIPTILQSGNSTPHHPQCPHRTKQQDFNTWGVVWWCKKVYKSHSMTTTYFNVSYSTDRLPRIPLRYVFYRFHSYHSFFFKSDQGPNYISDHYSYPNLALNSTLSNSISRPQEQSSNLLKDQFISIPRQLLYSPE